MLGTHHRAKAISYGMKIYGEWSCRRSVRFDESVTDNVDVDTDSETDKEVQTVPATEVKSVPVLARLR